MNEWRNIIANKHWLKHIAEEFFHFSIANNILKKMSSRFCVRYQNANLLRATACLLVNIHIDGKKVNQCCCCKANEWMKKYYWKRTLAVHDWNISQRSFSILALPIIFSKNVFSILCALPKRRFAKSMRRRPKRVVLLGELDSIWLRSIAKAWSCKFSTWEVSFRPAVSAKSRFPNKEFIVVKKLCLQK